MGSFNFSDLAVALGKDPTGKDVLIKYGAFLQTVFDFIIIALVLFLVIKAINRLKRPAPAAPAPPAPPPRSEVLLEEIRDLLAKRA
jgi:large conductance mechanosensitive channel